jgi:hypothetical protein
MKTYTEERAEVREYNYWLIEILRDGEIETLYSKTGVWQTRPNNALEITEAEFIKRTK